MVNGIRTIYFCGLNKGNSLFNREREFVWSSVLAPEFDKKHLKKADGRIGLNVVNCNYKDDKTRIL